MTLSINSPFFEQAALVGVVDPVILAPGSTQTIWIPVDKAFTYGATISVGTMIASATLDAKLQQATDNSGTGAKDIDNGAITQLTQAGGDSDKQVTISFRPEDLDIDNDFNHVQVQLTGAAANLPLSVTVHAFNHRYGPPESYELASLTERVSTTKAPLP